MDSQFCDNCRGNIWIWKEFEKSLICLNCGNKYPIDNSYINKKTKGEDRIIIDDNIGKDFNNKGD